MYDIAIVDDEKAIAEVIADVLAEEGYTVRIFHDGASALLDICEHPPQMVLLDISMPVMCGDELLRTLRRSGYDNLPIVMMSAGVRLNDFIDQGATDVIAKPFELDQLLSCVGAQVEPSRGNAA